MDVPKVSPHHPAAFQEAAALRERARQPRWTRLRDNVCLGGSTDQHLLCHHCLLVDIMHVRHVAAEGCGLHHLPTLETLNIPGVPLSRSDPAVIFSVPETSKSSKRGKTGRAFSMMYSTTVCPSPDTRGSTHPCGNNIDVKPEQNNLEN
jgi:hypothetical protein